MQVVGVVFVENETFLSRLYGHIVATPDVAGARQQPMFDVIVLKRLADAPIQRRTPIGQHVREENGVGKKVGDKIAVVSAVDGVPVGAIH